MKNKDLKKMLIEKSNEVEIRDLSQLIMQRIEKEVIVLPKKDHFKFALKLRPALLFIFVTLLTFSFFIFSPRNYTLAYQINQNEEQIILTSISTLQIGFSDIIIETSLDDDPLISDQIPRMNDYLLWMELLFNQDAFVLNEKTNPYIGSKKHYIFSSKALDNQMIQYEFVIMNSKNTLNYMTIDGFIKHDDDSYPFDIKIQVRQRSYEMNVIIDDHIIIQSSYQNQRNQKSFSFKVYDNHEIQSEIILNRSNENGNHVLDLTIEKGNIEGSYRFRRDNGVLAITYSIANQNRSESGTMRVEIKDDLGDKKFEIEVRPQGRPSFVIETPRPPVRPNPPRGKNNS